MKGRVLVFQAVLALVAYSVGPVAAKPYGCAVPQDLAALGTRLDRGAARIAREGSVRIVAIGSSSTEGAGASSPAMSYPSRLTVEMKARLPGTRILVANRGVGGQEVGQELARLGRDAIASHPDLVIWQVGTNAVLRHNDIAADRKLIRRGVAMLRKGRADVVLMDLQYAPRVLARRSYREMERSIDAIAREGGIGLFHRFAMMQYWATTGQLAPARLVGADGLHMTDASYGCLAQQLARALAAAWQPNAEASAHQADAATTTLRRR